MEIKNMDSAQNQLADKIKTTNNVLISVSRDPSVDQLAAMLGLALAINKTGRHAAAVFSGTVPSTLEFLQPEATFEKNTDSLRDFIIALDKAKADKLRYKVEDDLVRIFITPYKTSLSDADLAFSQGDFNVDLVIALGVTRQEDLDEAITAHGRILHDATVTSITTTDGQGDQLGSINWHDNSTSSLSELTTELIQLIDSNLIDGQIATSLLTGIVSETERFSNEKTSAQTMSISALLMAAGANQQLVASKLDEPEPVAEPKAPEEDTTVFDDIVSHDKSEDETSEEVQVEAPHEDGVFEINHENDEAPHDVEAPQELPEPKAPEEEQVEEAEPETDTKTESEPKDDPVEELKLGETGSSVSETPEPTDELLVPAPAFEALDVPVPGSSMVTDSPTFGGQLTANNTPEALEPSSDPLSVPSTNERPILTRGDVSSAPLPPEPVAETPVDEPTPLPVPAPEVVEEVPASVDPLLSDLEASVAAAEEDQPPQPEVGDARDEVSKAISSDASTQPLGAIEALNAQPLGDSLHPLDIPQPPEAQAPVENSDGYTSVEDLVGGLNATTPPAPAPFDPTAPPPVAPPLPFNFGQPPAGPSNPPQQQ